MTPADSIDFARSSIYVLLEIITPAMLTARLSQSRTRVEKAIAA